MSFKNKKWLLIVWFFLGLVILASDFFAGPNVAISFLFLIPVAMAAHYNGRFWGISLGILLPITRFCFHFAWHHPHPLSVRVMNLVIRIVILVGAAYLIDRVNRQAQEIKILRGILPVCMYCKKVRTEEHHWEQIETFITKRSEAKFSHTFCPECGIIYYADLVGGDDATSTKSGQG